jgi:hypothetical protein
MREVDGGLGVGEGVVARGLAARSCDLLAPPGPEPKPGPGTKPEPAPVAPRTPPVDAPRELGERFGPGCPESVDTKGLEVLPSGSCFLLKD